MYPPVVQTPRSPATNPTFPIPVSFKHPHISFLAFSLYALTKARSEGCSGACRRSENEKIDTHGIGEKRVCGREISTSIRCPTIPHHSPRSSTHTTQQATEIYPPYHCHHHCTYPTHNYDIGRAFEPSPQKFPSFLVIAARNSRHVAPTPATLQLLATSPSVHSYPNGIPSVRLRRCADAA